MPYTYNRHAQAIEWFSLKNKINKNYRGGRGHFFPRKAIVTVFLGENIGFEKSGMRPAVVVSVDSNNKSSGNIAVIPLTKDANKPGALLKSQYKLLKSKYKLNYDSIVQCEDMRIVSKARVGDVIDFVDDADMKQIEKRMKYFFDI
ncbi:type II toxin-antitoxin system PemK/MazF family toxin [Peribacillus phoenicis]|uniref:type II toxin-antitoxin system PemK/MazF family toxin n=1 Tax=unclassified Peribacillus TaxID=2675266 RepID=UPI002B3C6ED2|nr:type II toxin-antitoxin system PemK/MazF family toxin [Streptococcus pyogenes]HER2162556.1 type II toxin-antitoxin system PemK/MazF family toxin [Streptococcus pyogenes]